MNQEVFLIQNSLGSNLDRYFNEKFEEKPVEIIKNKKKIKKKK